MADQRAILDGIPIKIQGQPGIRDHVEPVVVQHEFVKKNGARLEHMGLRARQVNFTAFFKGKTEWENHKKILAAIGEQRLLDFVHPKYGLIRGMVSLYSADQNEIEYQSTINITFIEDTISSKKPTYSEDIAEAAKSQMSNINNQSIAGTENNINTTLGESGIGIAQKIIDFNNSVISEFSEITGPVRYFLKEIDRLVTAVEGTLTAVTNPINTFINALEFGTSLPGRIVKSVTQLAERAALLIEGFGTAPENFINSYRDQMLILEETLGVDDGTLGGSTPGSTVQKQYERAAKQEMQKTIRIVGAATAAVKLAELYATEDEKRRAIQQAEREESFDQNGNYLGADDTSQPIMTVQEIEESLAAEREYIQAAIDADRTVTGLHDMALSLVRNVNEIKIDLERVTTITVIGTEPLFTIMHRYGLPYKMIDRIVALNPDKPNPNKYSGEVKLYAA